MRASYRVETILELDFAVWVRSEGERNELRRLGDPLAHPPDAGELASAAVIIWVNGAFGAGKTTLAQVLHRRLPDAVIYDPEDVGAMLRKWMAPNEDFQDLPSWRELVVATALSLRRHHADVLIVPMSLLRDAYRDEIFNGLSDAGEPVLHVFLDVGDQALGDRLSARTAAGHEAGWDKSGYAWAMSRNKAAVGAAARQPDGTLVLRSDRLTPAELADAVLEETGLPSS